MGPSLFPSDDALPTWLHTVLCFAIVAPFALWLFWFAAQALANGRLDPLPGPEFGQYFFGSATLHGHDATMAGLSLAFIGLGFLALAYSFTRHSSGSLRARALPWMLLAVGLLISFAIPHPMK